MIKKEIKIYILSNMQVLKKHGKEVQKFIINLE